MLPLIENLRYYGAVIIVFFCGHIKVRAERREKIFQEKKNQIVVYAIHTARVSVIKKSDLKLSPDVPALFNSL